MGTDMFIFYCIYVLNFQKVQLYLVCKLYKSCELFLNCNFIHFLHTWIEILMKKTRKCSPLLRLIPVTLLL